MEISGLKKRQKDLQKQIPALQTAQLNAKTAYDTAFKDATKDATALARRAERSESMKRLFGQSARTSKELEDQKKANADYEKEIEKNKRTQRTCAAISTTGSNHFPKTLPTSFRP